MKVKKMNGDIDYLEKDIRKIKKKLNEIFVTKIK
jgi:hypothetical protein